METVSILPSFILPIVAVGIGFGFALFFKPSVSTHIKMVLSFSGAFLLATTIFEFLPEIYASGGREVSTFIVIGLLFQLFLEFGSKGAEHGHVHAAKSTTFPYLLFVSLCVHSFIEGLPIVHNTHLLYGVVVHKIPIAVIVSIFLLSAQVPKLQAGLFLVGFALMTPLGAFAKAYIPLLQDYSLYLNALAVGVILHVATTILFESSKNHQFNASKFISILAGVVLAYFI